MLNSNPRKILIVTNNILKDDSLVFSGIAINDKPLRQSPTELTLWVPKSWLGNSWKCCGRVVLACYAWQMM